MRELIYGLLTSEKAYFQINGHDARSILCYGNTTNQHFDTNEYNVSGEYDRFECGQPTGAVTGTGIANMLLVKVGITELKAKLGQLPVIQLAEWSMTNNGDQGMHQKIWWLYNEEWDPVDADNRYADQSAGITWYGDAYGLFPGKDRSAEPYSTKVGSYTVQQRAYWDITGIAAKYLRENRPIQFMHWDWYTSGTYGSFYAYYVNHQGYWPCLRFFYWYPVEFHASTGGAIDMAGALAETEDGHYDLGAVEWGETSAPVQGFVRNNTGVTKHVDIWDDHPEWTTPYQSAGTGTGQLDYVVLSEVAVSQKYTVVFYSATQYEVKAEAYRDNATSLHPQINADAQWRGTTGTDFSAPSGGLSIPAAAWQATGILSADEFVVRARGNSTDTGWPADSNDQMQMTLDDNGSADATAWRPVCGQRERTTAPVDIDATSKFIPTRRIDTSLWPVGNRCWIGDTTNYDEGTISAVQDRALGTDVFTGSGLDDLTLSGNYNGNGDTAFRVEIDGTGTPDTFKWSADGGSSWEATGVAITGSAQHLQDGVYVAFAATTGHTAADRWDWTSLTWGVTLGGLTAGAHAYAANTVVATTLPLRSVAPAITATVNAASGASQTPASRLYLDDTSGFSEGQTVFISQTTASETWEERTIAAGGVQSTYLDFTTAMDNDYAAGDWASRTDVGYRAFWLRVVANSTTAEELKRARLAARML